MNHLKANWRHSWHSCPLSLNISGRVCLRQGHLHNHSISHCYFVSYYMQPNLTMTHWPSGLLLMLKEAFKGENNWLPRENNPPLLDLGGQVNNHYKTSWTELSVEATVSSIPMMSSLCQQPKGRQLQLLGCRAVAAIREEPSSLLLLRNIYVLFLPYIEP